jgi:hypothetical protein
MTVQPFSFVNISFLCDKPYAILNQSAFGIDMNQKRFDWQTVLEF